MLFYTMYYVASPFSSSAHSRPRYVKRFNFPMWTFLLAGSCLSSADGSSNLHFFSSFDVSRFVSILLTNKQKSFLWKNIACQSPGTTIIKAWNQPHVLERDGTKGDLVSCFDELKKNTWCLLSLRVTCLYLYRHARGTIRCTDTSQVC